MTYKELVYMALDALKIHSDDSKFTEDHVVFLLNKYRAFVLNQKYSKTLDSIGYSNYQAIDLTIIPASDYIRSFISIPNILKISLPEIELKGIDDTHTPLDELEAEEINDRLKNSEIAFVSDKRFKYVGSNRFLKNIIYSTIKEDGYLYLNNILKILNNKPLHIKCTIKAVFEDPIIDKYTDILEQDFPLENPLVPSVLELVLKDLTNGIYKPSDNLNDAQDALSDLAGYLRRNMKSQFQKQIDE